MRLRFPQLAMRTPVMALNPEAKSPSRRAYVLKVRSDAKPDALAGRLENLVTGRQGESGTRCASGATTASDRKATVGG
jgi:hypothetical protein